MAIFGGKNIPSPPTHTESVYQKTGTDCIPKSEIENNLWPTVNNLWPKDNTAHKAPAQSLQRRINSVIPTLRPGIRCINCIVAHSGQKAQKGGQGQCHQIGV